MASARVFLAVAALVAIWMDPGEIRYSLWAYGLLAFYIAQGVVIILFLRRRQQSTSSFRVLVHSADIVWPAVISIFATSEANPFFLFFIFVLAAAAYRWGLWETVATAICAVALIWIESLSLYWNLIPWLNSFLSRRHLPLLQLGTSDFDPRRLFMRSISLLVLGLLLGYLAEQQKQLRAEKVVIARAVGRARVETGLTGTLQELAGEILGMYGAKHLMVASQEGHSHRVFVGEQAWSAKVGTFHWVEPSASDEETFLYKSDANAAFISRSEGNGSGRFRSIGLDDEGHRIADTDSDRLDRLTKKYEFQSFISVTFVFGREWHGRLFLLDPSIRGDIEEELRFLQEMVKQVGPAVYNVLLLRRLRLRAGAVERARFARELHDGAVQSLIAVEMQVDVLRRQAVADPGVVPDELERIQGLLREEVLKLRELMQQLKTLDVDAKRLLGVLSDTVERFQRETGIEAKFLTDLKEFDMPQPVCREISRIVQEALVNVRKHSSARQVLVRLGFRNGKWSLVVEDDGSGFPFTGRLSQGELDQQGKGPMVIKERVRLIEGELTIESNPGQGSRLEISVPQSRDGAYG